MTSNEHLADPGLCHEVGACSVGTLGQMHSEKAYAELKAANQIISEVIDGIHEMPCSVQRDALESVRASIGIAYRNLIVLHPEVVNNE